MTSSIQSSSKLSLLISQMLCTTQQAATIAGMSSTSTSFCFSKQHHHPFNLPYACSTTLRAYFINEILSLRCQLSIVQKGFHHPGKKGICRISQHNKQNFSSGYQTCQLSRFDHETPGMECCPPVPRSGIKNSREWSYKPLVEIRGKH